MAKRTVTRRRNPRSTTGMILVNPRPAKKRRGTKRAKARVAIRNPKRRVSAKRRTSTRKRNPTRRRTSTKRRASSRRRNPARRTSTRRSSSRRRVSTRRRRNGGQILVRSRLKRRNPSRRRRNPGALGRLRNPSSMFKRIPVIGPILANAVSMVGPAFLGAISIEPIMALVKLASPYLPMVPASGFYAVAGLVLAGVIPFLPFGSAAFKEKLALACASAAGGVAYYKFRTGQDVEVITEAAVVEMAGAGFGGLIPGPSSGMYQPPAPVPAVFSGGGYWNVQPSGVGAF